MATKKKTTTKKTTSSKKTTSKTKNSAADKAEKKAKDIIAKGSASDKQKLLKDLTSALAKKTGSSSSKTQPKTTTTTSKTVTPTQKTSTPSYTGGSVVDYLNSQGQKSDFSTRSGLASQYGISGYTGTADQNTKLLKLLQSGSQKATSQPKATVPTQTGGVSYEPQTLNVDDKLLGQLNIKDKPTEQPKESSWFDSLKNAFNSVTPGSTTTYEAPKQNLSGLAATDNGVIAPTTFTTDKARANIAKNDQYVSQAMQQSYSPIAAQNQATSMYATGSGYGGSYQGSSQPQTSYGSSTTTPNFGGTTPTTGKPPLSGYEGFEYSSLDMDEKLQKAFSEIDDSYYQAEKQLKNIKTNIDDVLSDTLKSIQVTLQDRRDETKDLNAQQLALLEKQGIRGGAQRYSPEVNTGILGAETARGIKRLAQIDSEEQSLIVEAKNAALERKWSVYNSSVDMAKQKNIEKRQAAQDIYNKLRQEQQDAMELSQFYRDIEKQDLANMETKVVNVAQALYYDIGYDLSQLNDTILSSYAEQIGVPKHFLKNAVVALAQGETEDIGGDLGQYLTAIKMGVIPASTSYDAFLKMGKTGSGAGGLTPYQQFQGAMSLSKDLDNLTEASRLAISRANLAQQAYDRYMNGETNDLNATTQVIINNFNKILDPASVVRESEYARSPEGQSLIGNIEGRLNKLAQGGAGLTAESLGEFVELGNLFAKNAADSIEKKRTRAVQFGQEFGLNTDFIGGAYTPAETGDVSQMSNEDLLAQFGLLP